MMDMLNIAILGFGNIGSGLAEVIERNQPHIRKVLGGDIFIKYVLDRRDLSQTVYADRAVTDFEIILNDPEVAVVCEMMGGTQPAFDYAKAAMTAGKSVVTSNKEVVAEFGVELLQVAAEHGVSYLYEASVGGAVPVMHAMRHSLAGTEISRIDGILNGTTNYILTRMQECHSDFNEALNEAKRLGYAEVNPAADVSGMDACRKICILAASAWQVLPAVKNVYCEGILDVTEEDQAFAVNCGGVLKLVATAIRIENGALMLAVSPCMLLNENPLRAASGVFNAVRIEAGDTGELMFYGEGAGRYPTSGALISDILEAATIPAGGVIWKSWEDEMIPYEDMPMDWCVEIRASRDVLQDLLETYAILYEQEGILGLFCSFISKNDLLSGLAGYSVQRILRAIR